MTTPREREAAQSSIADETRELEDAKRELTKIIEQGDTPYGGSMKERLADQARKIARIKNNLKGKQEILDKKDKSVNELIADEERELETLRAARQQELDRNPQRAEELKRANEKVRDAEEVQDGKRHVRDSLLPRPGGPAQGVEVSFYSATGVRLISLVASAPDLAVTTPSPSQGGEDRVRQGEELLPVSTGSKVSSGRRSASPAVRGR